MNITGTQFIIFMAVFIGISVLICLLCNHNRETLAELCKLWFTDAYDEKSFVHPVEVEGGEDPDVGDVSNDSSRAEDDADGDVAILRRESRYYPDAIMRVVLLVWNRTNTTPSTSVRRMFYAFLQTPSFCLFSRHFSSPGIHLDRSRAYVTFAANTDDFEEGSQNARAISALPRSGRIVWELTYFDATMRAPFPRRRGRSRSDSTESGRRNTGLFCDPTATKAPTPTVECVEPSADAVVHTPKGTPKGTTKPFPLQGTSCVVGCVIRPPPNMLYAAPRFRVNREGRRRFRDLSRHKNFFGIDNASNTRHAHRLGHGTLFRAGDTVRCTVDRERGTLAFEISSETKKRASSLSSGSDSIATRTSVKTKPRRRTIGTVVTDLPKHEPLFIVASPYRKGLSAKLRFVGYGENRKRSVLW